MRFSSEAMEKIAPPQRKGKSKKTARLFSMAIYSHSKLSNFEQCKLKFKYRYIDKIIPEVKKTIETHLGSAVHDTLEWFYNNIQNKDIPTIDQLIIHYSEEWQKNFHPEMIIVNKTLTAKDYFNKGVQFLLDYYTKNHPFDDNTIELEKKIFIELDGERGHKIIGYIDRLSYNLKTCQYEIHDYKTANNLPTQERIDNDRQLALYSLAIKELFGHDKEVILIWHYLAHNKKITSKRTNKQLQQLKQETLELIKEIENTTQFPPQKSILCNWCEYKSMCPAWGNKSLEPKEKQSSLFS